MAFFSAAQCLMQMLNVPGPLTAEQALNQILGMSYPSWGGTSTGSADAQVIAPAREPSAYVEGQWFGFKAGYTNTGAATLQVGDLDPVAIRQNDAALGAGDLTAGQTYQVMYDGSHFQLYGQATAVGDIPNLPASKITSGQLAQAVGGTGADLSASGGATHFLAQAANHAVSARAIAADDLPTAINAANIADGSVSNTEFQYLNGVTSAIQAQIDGLGGGGGSVDGSIFYSPFAGAVYVGTPNNATLSSGDNVLYTCPSGKKAFFVQTLLTNYSGGTIGYSWKFKVSGGTAYTFAFGANIGAGNTQTGNVSVPPPVFEAGDQLIINCAASGASPVSCLIIEFPDTVPVKKALLSPTSSPALASGLQTLLTCPANKKQACATATSSFAPTNASMLGYANNSGGTRTIELYLVRSGDSANTSGKLNRITKNNTTVATGAIFAFVSSFGMVLAAGDTIQFSTDANTSSQLVWVTYFEWSV